MATIVLLTSESFVKQFTSISDNIAGKYMRSAILDTQEIELKRIIGSCLLSKLKSLVASDEIALPENGIYQDTLDYIQPYMAYRTAVELATKVSFKISNIGVHRNSDDNVSPVTSGEVIELKGYYQSKADAACIELQRWLIANKSRIPELDCCTCANIEANLRDAVSCGIFLGGRRGARR